MSETKWTPGPWAIRYQFNVYGAGDRLAANTGGHSDNRDPDGGTAENKANAALVSAAPDLYEALAGTLALARLKWGNLDDGANTVFAHADAALLKARGA